MIDRNLAPTIRNVSKTFPATNISLSKTVMTVDDGCL